MRITNRFIGIVITIVIAVVLNFIWYNHEFPEKGWSDLDKIIMIGAALTWVAGGMWLLWFVANLYDDTINFEIIIPIPGTNLTKRKQLEKRITSVKKEIEKNKSRQYQYHCDRNFKDEAEEAEYAEMYEHFGNIIKDREKHLEKLIQELRECEE